MAPASSSSSCLSNDELNVERCTGNTFFFRKFEGWSLPRRADKYRHKALQLYFDKEADVPLAWFSELDLPERDESENRQDCKHCGLPDVGRAIEEDQATPSFPTDGVKNQALVLSLTSVTPFFGYLDTISSPDFNETFFLESLKSEHSNNKVLPILKKVNDRSVIHRCGRDMHSKGLFFGQ